MAVAFVPLCSNYVPPRELPWLEDSLDQARQAGEKVLLIGHHSVSEWAQDFGDIFKMTVSQIHHDTTRPLEVGRQGGSRTLWGG